MIRAVVALLALLAALLPALAQVYPFTWYWVVGDTLPSSQVWNGATGAFVSNTDATYEAWLTALANGQLQSQGIGIASPICNVTNNGNDRITLCNSINNGNGWATNQFKTVFGVGGVPGVNGNWAINNANAVPPQVDLQGSTFTGAYTSGGVIGAGTYITTNAQLLTMINSYALSCYLQNAASSNTQTSAANILLTNPAPRLQIITMSTTGKNVQMPQANLFASCFPIGWPVVINNPGSNAFAVTDFGAMNTLAASVAAGTTWEFYLTGNASQQGTWKAVQVQ